MKDNLAPISDKAIKAYLFDLVKNSTNPKIESIEEELDLTIEAKNMEIADKTYAYNKDVAEIGTFTNTTSAKLFGGVKPTSSVMVQEKAEGTTLKKFIDESKDRLSNPKANIPRGDLEAMKEKLTKTHSALVSTSYMWANEGLFGSGFYHGDLHAGNMMVDANGKVTMIDFGNATQIALRPSRRSPITHSAAASRGLWSRRG